MSPLNFYDWPFTAEQLAVRDNARRFVQEQVHPIIASAWLDGRFPRELVPALGRLGALGATSQRWGAGIDYTAYGLLCQELEAGDSGLRSFISVQGALCMLPIERFGSDVQQARWLPGLAAGDLIACFGLTEPDIGSDPASMTTRASRDGEGWVLDGVKSWITNATIADVAVVWARVAGGAPGEVRGFLVEAGTPGFTTRAIDDKLSMRASETGELVFQDCRLPAGSALPGVGTMRGPLTCLTEARFGICFGVIGAATACYEAAVDYAAQRQQWGRPIGGFQLTQDKLANALEAITAGQLLAYQLGSLKDAGGITPAQISLAKRANCRAALEVARSMRSILGANGITTDYPVFRHMANLETVYTYEGTHEIHSLILGEHITGYSALRG